MAQNNKTNKNKQPKQSTGAAKKNVQEKTAQQKKKQSTEQRKKCGCCRWVLGSIILVALIAGSLIYDTEVNGKGVFAKSATGKMLKNAGLLPHVEKVWYSTMGAAARGYKWAEKNVPQYAKPVLTLLSDLFKVARVASGNLYNSVLVLLNEKLPIVGNLLDQYVPGLSSRIVGVTVNVKNIVFDICGKTTAIVKTQVLVGNLSPENLSKALNQTRNLALEYLNTFHKKVDLYAKLK